MRKRVWIIGNGPSLKDTPLDLLKGEDTFAMNRIHLIYPQTDWRPTHYFLIDFCALAPELWKEPIEVHKYLGIPLWLWDMFRTGFPQEHPNYEDLPQGLGDIANTTWVPRCKAHHFYNWPNSKALHEWHLPTLCTGLNITSTMMQVAVQMGYREIYLLGCDCNYTSSWSDSYFHPDYNRWENRDLSEKNNANAIGAHTVAAKSSPIPITNCSLDHKALDHIYPWRRMERVVCEPG